MDENGVVPSPHWLDEPHHDLSPFYCDSATAELGDEVPVRVWVPHAAAARQVVLRVLRDGEPLVRTARADSGDEFGTWWAVDVLMLNPVASYRFLLDGADGSYSWLNGTGRHHHDVTDARGLPAARRPPPAARLGRGRCVYQVFPDRFARSGGDHSGTAAPPSGAALPPWATPAGWDDEPAADGPLTSQQWFGGDLAGIEQHLDHLVGLGVNVLYLTPVFEARSNHRYDAVSFDRVDPLLGGDAAMASLPTAAHARGHRACSAT